METIEIKAKLTYIIFENKASNYVVGQFFQEDPYSHFTGAGRMKDAKEDTTYILCGQYVTHPKYGQQFQILTSKPQLPTHEKAIVHFLSGPDFSGIGKKLAQDIYDVLGDDCLALISQDINCLDQVEKITPKKKEIIKEGMKQYGAYQESYLQLVQYGLDANKINLLEDHYNDVLKEIKDDCFKPYYEIYGFGYKSALKLADGMNLAYDDQQRLDAQVYETCRQLAMASGNTYMTYASVRSRFSVDIKEAIQHLIERKVLFEENEKLYLYTLYKDETTIAKEIIRHNFNVEKISKVQIDTKISQIEFAYNITYDAIQKQAIHLFFSNSQMILNGGPGTGKTTTVKAILSLAQELWPDAKIQLCAPTGRASKRLAQVTLSDCKTIHSLLKWNKDDNTFAVNKDAPLDIDVLIVDEFSMVDTHLMAMLMEGIPSHCRILFIGDENQLESVGPGKVFEDLINSQIMPVVHLQKIFRQSDGSGIVDLAQSIRQEIPCTYENGVQMIQETSQKIIEHLMALLPDDVDLNQTQILAPMYKGIAGIDRINQAMQQRFNPEAKGKLQIKVANTIFREGDKVMLLKNLPDDNVFNGDIGTILEISTESKNTTITVDFIDEIVDFDHDFLYYLTHAYCISVHKAQGSEYQTVFCIVDPSSIIMLEKRLLYTAISRAKKQLYILGDQGTFEHQVKQHQKKQRQTTLLEKIKLYDLHSV